MKDMTDKTIETMKERMVGYSHYFNQGREDNS